MNEKTVGEFKVTVSDPYPWWVSVEHKYAHGAPLKFDHDQLDDLIYALERARSYIEKQQRAERDARIAKADGPGAKS